MKNTGQAKVDEVQGYLERFFPGQVRWSVAQGEAAFAFHVRDVMGGMRHEVHVSDAFLGRHPADALQRVLSELRLIDHLRNAGTTPVHVDASGVDVAPAARRRPNAASRRERGDVSGS